MSNDSKHYNNKGNNDRLLDFETMYDASTITKGL